LWRTSLDIARMQGADMEKNVHKLALITGGSSGLGYEMARQLRAQGYCLILVARDRIKLERAKQTLTASGDGPAVYAISCDLADDAAVQRAFDEIRMLTQRIDFLILNAGVASIELIEDYSSLSVVTGNLRANLIGAVAATHLALPLMQEGSRILFVSSGFAFVGPAGYTLYATAKAGLNVFADGLRRELLRRKISVHVTCPGDIDTPMYQGELRNMPDWIRAKMGRGKPMSVEKAAHYIIARCFRGRYMIVPSADVRFLIAIQSLLPRWLSMRLIDRILPLPPGS
jgi:NAD(P)-dependent dehydrogenase (short-subunit alcohol dehydrogenase family)